MAKVSSPRSLTARIDALGVSQDALASIAGVYPGEVSRHVRGFHVSDARKAAIEGALTSIEELVRTPNALVPNMRRPDSIRAALANLKKIKAEEEAEPARTLSFEILSTPRDPSRGLAPGKNFKPDVSGILSGESA
jgi:hypothetical protein